MEEDKEKEEKRNILKYQELIKDKNTLSRLYDTTEENIKECAKYITIYGLAANAFDVDACFKIF